MANRVKAAMGHEGRAQTCAKDQIVAERLEPHGILERGARAGGSPSTIFRAGSGGQNSRVCLGQGRFVTCRAVSLAAMQLFEGKRRRKDTEHLLLLGCGAVAIWLVGCGYIWGQHAAAARGR